MSSNNNTPKLRFPEFSGEWEDLELGQICQVNRGVRVTRRDLTDNGQYPVFQNTNSPMGFYNMHNVKANNPFVIIGGSAGLIGFCTKDFWAADDCVYFGDCDELDKFFLYSTLLAHAQDIKKYVRGGNIPRIDRKSLEKLSVSLPPRIAEQQKIASCLSEMDNLISAQERKVDALKEKKKGLMQQLFPRQGETTPRLRFPGFAGVWEEKNFSEVFSRRTEKNSENNKNVLTISAQYGLISQLEFFKKSVSAADVTGYYLLHKGDFAYNKSSSQGKPVGAIKPLKLYDKGVVSTLYICFRCKDHDAIGFWEQYFDAGLLDKEIMTIAQEGARNHGLLNVPTSDFFGLKVKLPSPSEQQKIAECLSSLDELIAAETAKLDTLNDHKKGLMQQLFPQTTK